MLFRHLFRPRWQHRNPKLRKQAVLALPPASQDILLEVARNDAEPELRSLAIGRLVGLAALEAIARDDPHPGVQETATARYLTLFAGLDPGAPELGVRLGLVGGLSDARALEYLARKAVEPSLRLAAARRVERESLLGEIALEDPDPQLRLAAVERVTQESTLERVARLARSRDKRVSRIARERLAAIAEERERPMRLRTQREALCADMEALVRRGTWSEAQAALERLERQWQALEGEVEPELGARFNAAASQVHAALGEERARQAEQRREEQALAPIREEKLSLCRAVEDLAQDLGVRETLDEEEEGVVSAILATTQQGWEQAGSLPAVEQANLAARFERARSAVAARHAELRGLRGVASRRQDLCQRAEAGLTAEPPLGEAAIKDLQREWQGLEGAAREGGTDAGEARFHTALRALRERAQARQQTREQELAELRRVVQELEEALDRGELKTAGPLLSQGQATLKGLADLSPGRVARLEGRLQAAAARVRELQDWARWGSTREREQLCARVEGLVGVDADPAETARLIREARDAWNRLGPADREAHKTLSERFNAACEAAFEPCRIYFAEQSQIREQNLARREALCERLEQFNASADWQAMDWKALEGLLRESRQEWQAVGATERGAMKKVGKRYSGAINVLQRQLRGEHERRLAAKRALAERVEQLAAEDDLREAVRQIKQAQVEWKAVGGVPRRQEQEVWERFRAACDVVFERRREQAEARERERQEAAAFHESLCARAEALAASSGAALEDGQRELQALRAQWDTAPSIPAEQAKSFRERFAAAVEAFEVAQRSYRRALQREAVAQLAEKSALCVHLEELWEQGDAASAAPQLSAARERWHSLPALEPSLEEPLRARFDRCTEALLDTQEGTAPRAAQDAANQLAALEGLCIQMEVLAGVESPPEAARARLEYQVERLAAGLGQSPGQGASEGVTVGDGSALSQALDLQRAWYLIGPVPAAQRAPLAERFRRAQEALYARLGV